MMMTTTALIGLGKIDNENNGVKLSPEDLSMRRVSAIPKGTTDWCNKNWKNRSNSDSFISKGFIINNIWLNRIKQN